ncbi:hypothetical protein SAMN02910263_04166 [Butyrivibrio sp. INlla16]|nr:hypothetical protein SAMN02910263_04166 [Butyrivibrio sp. INlla16]
MEKGIIFFPFTRQRGPIREMGKGAKSAVLFCGFGGVGMVHKKGSC